MPGLSIVLAAALAAAAPPTGDLRPTYDLPGAETPLAYHVYVPPAWHRGEHWPLVMILHGFGSDADRPFAQGGETLRAAADAHRFILVAPAGYDGKGDWGANLPLPGPVAATAMQRLPRQNMLAEADAMAVYARVAQSYGTDPRRGFVIGNSMGMTGVLHLAVKYDGSWCGIGPSDGPPWPDYPADRLRHLKGAFLAHGEADTVAAIADTQAVAERLRAAGIETRFLPIPGGVHGTAWVSAIHAMFDFFAGLPCR